MTPEIELCTPIRYLKGVGPERSKILAVLELHTLKDLFYFFPRRYEDRSVVKKIAELKVGELVSVHGMVMSRGLVRTRSSQSIFRAVISDGKDTFFISFFNQPYLTRIFTPKAKLALYGRVEREGNHFKMTHPEYEIFNSESIKQTLHSGRIVPIYSLTGDLTQKRMRRLLFQLTSEHWGALEEHLDKNFRHRNQLEDVFFGFREIHFPTSFETLQKAYRRLVFDEFFLLQLVIQMKKKSLKIDSKDAAHKRGEEEVARLIDSFEFTLTEGQKKTIDEITRDMKKDCFMNRLLQGDVGSGKTAVAACGIIFTTANGFQAALMAPTEVLAQQHYFTLSGLLEPFGITCEYLSGSQSSAARKVILERIASGKAQVIIGTHALIEEDVAFKNLGLVVIDEQHKFGVTQRASLKGKNTKGAHFLLMTATPIPRTLASTLYGDMDLSSIYELPKGRKPIKTLWVGEEKRRNIYELLDSVLEEGRQGYCICPLIDASEKSDLKNAVNTFEDLKKIFSHRKVGLLHGRMKAEEKKRVMREFKKGSLEILISTVVIEVGVDVPNATIMIIENAERFGLAQLHQLRGRIGRGSEESVCVLFSSTESEETFERLSAFQSTQSGFDIAEKDLELRGGGDIVGERQHGLPALRIGHLTLDASIMERARGEAIQFIEKDSKLALPENQSLRRAVDERFGINEKPVPVFS